MQQQHRWLPLPLRRVIAYFVRYSSLMVFEATNFDLLLLCARLDINPKSLDVSFSNALPGPLPLLLLTHMSQQFEKSGIP